MIYKAHKCLICWLFASVFFLCAETPGWALILHPDGEPNLATWTDRPDPNVLGRWGWTASCVAIAPNFIITTRHQCSGIDENICFSDGHCYKVGQIWNEPDANGQADLRVCRIVTLSGEPANLTSYVGIYEDSNETGKNIVIGGYGNGRGGELTNPPQSTVYGYEWDGSSNTTLRWGTNAIDSNYSTEGSVCGEYFETEAILAYFDGLGEPNSPYECALAMYDSGGGWFIKVDDQWLLAALTETVQHSGESWFNPPDAQIAVRISPYAEWINSVIASPTDLTQDGWVDWADVAQFAMRWRFTDCNDLNNWCQGADFDQSQTVDPNDLFFLAEQWLCQGLCEY